MNIAFSGRIAALVAALSIGTVQAAGNFGQPDKSFDAETPQFSGCLGVAATLGDGSTYVVGSPAAGYEVLRYLGDGTLDPSWGNSGRAALPEPARSFILAEGFLPLPAGNLIVVGNHLVRLNHDGSIDPTYGDSGFSALVTPDSAVVIEGFALQPDGSVVVATNGYNGVPSLLFARFDPHGRRDPGFGVNGSLAITLADGQIVYGWSVQDDGSIEYGIYTQGGTGAIHPQLRHIPRAASEPDPSFNFNGRLIPIAGAGNWLSANVKVQADGAVLFSTSGCLDAACSHPAVAISRYTAAGTVDTSFGGSGLVFLTPYTPSNPLRNSVAPHLLSLVTGGKMTVILDASETNGGFFPTIYEANLRTYRLNADGSLDTSFDNGAVLAADRAKIFELPNGELLQAPGRTPQCVTKLLTDVQATDATLVEYFQPQLGHYFLTAEGLESGILDDNVATMGWIRTGRTFGGWFPVELPGATKVCRFYGDLVAGPNSHFYTPQGPECDGLLTLAAQAPLGTRAWRLEGYTFSVAVAEAGQCPNNLMPVYRVYNRGFEHGVDPNHRYMTDTSVYAAMQAQGWAPEGVRFCVPPVNASSSMP